MLRSPAVLATAVGSLTVMLMTGCAKSDTPPAAPAEAVTYARDIVLADFTITAPDTLPAGWTTFTAKNSAQELHHATLVRIDSGHTVQELVDGMKKPGPPPAWASWLGGPQQQSSISINMTPGNYAWICLIPSADGTPHFAKGMFKAFTVVASTGASPAEPTADIEVTAKDYTWTLSTPVTAGSHTLKFTTAAGQPHEAVLLRAAPGKTAKDILTWMDKMEGPPPVEQVHGISALQPGSSQYEKMDFTPGHYVMLCFVPDAKDGKAHIAHGMVLEFDVK